MSEATNEQIVEGIALGVQRFLEKSAAEGRLTEILEKGCETAVKKYLEKAEERIGIGEKPLDRFEKGVKSGTALFFEDYEEEIERRIEPEIDLNTIGKL